MSNGGHHIRFALPDDKDRGGKWLSRGAKNSLAFACTNGRCAGCNARGTGHNLQASRLSEQHIVPKALLNLHGRSPWPERPEAATRLLSDILARRGFGLDDRVVGDPRITISCCDEHAKVEDHYIDSLRSMYLSTKADRLADAVLAARLDLMFAWRDALQHQKSRYRDDVEVQTLLAIDANSFDRLQETLRLVETQRFQADLPHDEILSRARNVVNAVEHYDSTQLKISIVSARAQTDATFYQVLRTVWIDDLDKQLRLAHVDPAQVKDELLRKPIRVLERSLCAVTPIENTIDTVLNLRAPGALEEAANRDTRYWFGLIRAFVESAQVAHWPARALRIGAREFTTPAEFANEIAERAASEERIHEMLFDIYKDIASKALSLGFPWNASIETKAQASAYAIERSNQCIHDIFQPIIQCAEEVVIQLRYA